MTNKLSSKYYDRYWKKNIKGGIMNQPALWEPSNFQWHFNYFCEYIGKKVLDVGAGDGTFIHLIKSRLPHLKATAIDQSSVAISKAAKKYPDIKFYRADIEKMPFPNGSFETVFAIEVLEHLFDIDVCLSELCRIIKPGGFLCITTTDFNLPKKLIIAALFWNRFFYPNNPHIRFFTRQTLTDICAKHNLKLVAYKWNKSYFGLMPRGQMAIFTKY